MLDIDGFRIDKALTITGDAQADWSEFIRGCAKNVGKTNFFLPGEIVSGNVLASVYLGRGKEPQMAVATVEEALNLPLHNAEFQGLWPMRTPQERDEVCAVFNIDTEIPGKYVQFGEVFNLLHAGASYLRIHQKGFGAVGASKKYGK